MTIPTIEAQGEGKNLGMRLIADCDVVGAEFEDLRRDLGSTHDEDDRTIDVHVSQGGTVWKTVHRQVDARPPTIHERPQPCQTVPHMIHGHDTTEPPVH